MREKCHAQKSTLQIEQNKKYGLETHENHI